MTLSAHAHDSRLSRRESLLALGGATALAGLATIARAADPAKAVSTGVPDWPGIARQFYLTSEVTYLNTGTLGSVPIPVLDIRQDFEKRMEANPAQVGFGPVSAAAEAVRPKIAAFIGAKSEEVTVNRNTTEGMNLLAEGLNLQPGDRVLTSNHEHPGGIVGWKHLVQHRKVILDEADLGTPPESEDQVVESFRAALRPETRVISVSHVTFSSGVQVPIARLADLAHAHNCFLVVDGAQAAGAVPVNVQALKCDAYATSGHKWMLGPKGTGFLYVRESVKSRVAPITLGDGYGVYTANRGTSNWPDIIGFGASIDWAGTVGNGAIYARLMELRNQLYEVVQKTPGVRPACPAPGSSMASQLVTFALTDPAKLERVNQQFKQDRIVVRGVQKPGVNFRVGCHVYNSEKDISLFADSLRKGLS